MTPLWTELWRRMTDDPMSDRQALVDYEEPPLTGDEDIDVALAELASIGDEPLDRHIDVGEAVHRVLRGRLGGLSNA